MEEQLDLVTEVYQLIVNFLVNYSFQLLGAVLVLVLGFIVGGWVSRAVLRLMEHRNVDLTLREFLAGVVKMIVVGVFLLAVLDKLGISVTPLIAAIGGLAVGASFAIQGPVSNYGAGLVIILTRMFKNNEVGVKTGKGFYDQIEEAVAARKRELIHLARVERARLQSFFDFCCFDHSFVDLRRRSRQDLETTGNAYWEVLRDGKGDIARLVCVTALLWRLTRTLTA